MNLFVLLGKAETTLETGDDPYFNEVTELVTSILRTEEVLPYKRISLNGALHQLFSGIIVAAYEAETSIDVTSRHTATYHEYGFTTKAVGWTRQSQKGCYYHRMATKRKVRSPLGRF